MGKCRVMKDEGRTMNKEWKKTQEEGEHGSPSLPAVITYEF